MPKHSYKRKSSKKKNAKPETLIMLKQFGTGWQEKFNKRLESINKLFPEATLNTASRYHGMLRLDFSAPSDDIQYLLDCVAYRIERESAKTCELCGNNALRRTGDPRLPEPKCLCMPCYALVLDEYLTHGEPIN